MCICSAGRKSLGISCYHSLLHSLERRALTGLGLTMVWTDWQSANACSFLLSLPSQSLRLKPLAGYAWLFTWEMGIWSQGLVLAEKVLLPTESFSNPLAQSLLLMKTAFQKPYNQVDELLMTHNSMKNFINQVMECILLALLITSIDYIVYYFMGNF